jgi:hypothetical protein
MQFKVLLAVLLVSFLTEQGLSMPPPPCKNLSSECRFPGHTDEELCFEYSDTDVSEVLCTDHTDEELCFEFSDTDVSEVPCTGLQNTEDVLMSPTKEWGLSDDTPEELCFEFSETDVSEVPCVIPQANGEALEFDFTGSDLDFTAHENSCSDLPADQDTTFSASEGPSGSGSDEDNGDIAVSLARNLNPDFENLAVSSGEDQEAEEMFSECPSPPMEQKNNDSEAGTEEKKAKNLLDIAKADYKFDEVIREKLLPSRRAKSKKVRYLQTWKWWWKWGM